MNIFVPFLEYFAQITTLLLLISLLGLVHTVWNLAAPLSVETAQNPKIAEQVTINGMRNVPFCTGDGKFGMGFRGEGEDLREGHVEF